MRGVVAALGCAAIMVACELPTRPRQDSGAASRLTVSPQVVSLQQNQAADFTAIGFTTAGDTANVAVSWSATSGSIIDTNTSNGRHNGRYRAGADTGNVRVVAKGNPGGPADTAIVTVTLAPVTTVAVSPATASVAAASATPHNVLAKCLMLDPVEMGRESKTVARDLGNARRVRPSPVVKARC